MDYAFPLFSCVLLADSLFFEFHAMRTVLTLLPKWKEQHLAALGIAAALAAWLAAGDLGGLAHLGIKASLVALAVAAVFVVRCLPLLVEEYRLWQKIAKDGDALDRQVSPEMTALDLHAANRRLDRETMARFLRKRLRDVPNLERLTLRSNDLYEDGARLLAAELRHLPKLKHLDCGFTFLPDAGAAAIAAELRHVPELQSLELGHNVRFGLAGAAALAAGLGSVPGLRSLDLKYNPLKVAGVEALCARLCDVPKLEALTLRGTQATDRGVAAIVAAAQHLQNLQTLDLSDNSITDEGAAAIARALPRLRTLRRLELAMNSVTEAGAEALRAAIAQRDGEKPALVL